ncbi:NF038104 family lipoprotein [Terricaulis sp.]|uniref:NF038104 family lipoprotein n=1 Tax=Terricaulis sp. TaxID=2768686 RepID=UPI0037849C86
MKKLVLLLIVAPMLAGCLAATVIGAAGSIAGATVGAAVDVGGAVVGAAIPDDKDDDDHD